MTHAPRAPRGLVGVTLRTLFPLVPTKAWLAAQLWCVARGLVGVVAQTTLPMVLRETQFLMAVGSRPVAEAGLT